MSDKALSIEQQKKQVLEAKKWPINFGYAPGPKGADFLLMDKRKRPSVLGKEAKADKDTGAKAVFGSFRMEKKELKVTAEKTIPGFAKSFRKYLKKLGLFLSVVVLDESGNLLESDLDEETQAGTAAEGPQAGAEDQANPNSGNDTKAAAPAEVDRAALLARLKAMQDPIAALGASGKTLKKAATQVVGFLKEGNAETAAKTLAAMEEHLAKTQAAGAAKAEADQKAVQNDAQDAPPEKAAAAGSKALISRAGALKKALDQFPSAPASALKSDLARAMALLKERDLSAADAILTEAEQSVAALPNTAPAKDAAEQPDPATTKAARQWQAAQAQLATQVAKAVDAGRGDVAGIEKTFAFAEAQASEGAYESAVKAAARTAQLIRDAAKAPPADTDAIESEDGPPRDGGVPDNIVAYTKSRLKWVSTRSGLQAELVKLKMAIDRQTAGIEGLEDIAQNTGVLLDYLDELDLTLENELETLVNTPEGPARAKVKNQAIKIINDYRATLDSDFFQAVDQNGFTDTKIRATALDALKNVETALAV